ncbi:MAG: rhodanese-like domain-containing protein [Calditrichaeota bacterium]|nr:MAG: rhodanese-like domain-containing protein [Calditrichota bacterium]
MEIRDLLTEKRLQQMGEMVAEITVAELKAKINAGEVFKLVDVSTPEDFESGHIAGAINIPLATLEETALRLFKPFQQIVVYAAETSSSLGMVAARLLQHLGFTNVLALKGGKEAWKNAGYPLEGEAKPGEQEK